MNVMLRASRDRTSRSAEVASKPLAPVGGWSKAATAVAIGGLVTSLMVASPVSAASSHPTPEEVREALTAAGVLSIDSSRGDTASADVPLPAEVSVNGLTIEAEDAVLTMTPVAAGESVELESGLVVFSHATDASFALTSSARGANAGYSVLTGPAAPGEFRYEFTVDGGTASFSPTEDGGLAVLDPEGKVVNLLAPAWAIDASGAQVATEYVVDGSAVIQVVHHSSANAYPIVADPRLRCDTLWCTVEATRAETAAIADNALNAGILCTFVPNYGGAVACAGVVIGAWAAANAARAQGLCIGYRYWRINYTLGHVVPVVCYA